MKENELVRIVVSLNGKVMTDKSFMIGDDKKDVGMVYMVAESMPEENPLKTTWKMSGGVMGNCDAVRVSMKHLSTEIKERQTAENEMAFDGFLEHLRENGDWEAANRLSNDTNSEEKKAITNILNLLKMASLAGMGGDDES